MAGGSARREISLRDKRDRYEEARAISCCVQWRIVRCVGRGRRMECKCGAYLASDTRHCPQCGREVNPDAPPAPSLVPRQPSYRSAPQRNEGQPKRSKTAPVRRSQQYSRASPAPVTKHREVPANEPIALPVRREVTESGVTTIRNLPVRTKGVSRNMKVIEESVLVLVVRDTRGNAYEVGYSSIFKTPTGQHDRASYHNALSTFLYLLRLDGWIEAPSRNGDRWYEHRLRRTRKLA